MRKSLKKRGRKRIITALSLSEPTSDQSLYAEFALDIQWIRERVWEDYQTLPPLVQDTARYYLSQRVKLLHDGDSVPPHPLSPRPIPYLAFWFARAFGLDNVKVRRLLGLSLAYVCLSSSPRDDQLDEPGLVSPQQVYMAGWFWEKYFLGLKRLFPTRSPIWYIVSKSMADWDNCERSMLFQNLDEAGDPLSTSFLRKTSRYLVALIFPTLAGAALLGNRPRAVNAIRRFTCYYCMGWRILDDLRDWQEDSSQPTANNSSVLSFLRTRTGIPRGAALTRETVVSLFSDQAIVGHIYSAMEGFFLAAKHEAENLQATYVTRFIDQQLLGHKTECFRIAAAKNKFSNTLMQLLQGEHA